MIRQIPKRFHYSLIATELLGRSIAACCLQLVATISGALSVDTFQQECFEVEWDVHLDNFDSLSGTDNASGVTGPIWQLPLYRGHVGHSLSAGVL